MTKRTFLLLINLLLVEFAVGQTNSWLISSAGDETDYPESNVLTVYDSTQVKVQESGLSYVRIHQLFKVLTPQGALNMRCVVAGYDPLSAHVEIQMIKVYRKGKVIRVFDGKDVLDYPATAHMIYWGAREKMVEVGRLIPGDGIEVKLFRKGFTYALLGGLADEGNYIPPMRGHYYDIVHFYSSEPVKLKVYQVELPKSKQLQYKIFNNDKVKVYKKDLGKRVQYNFLGKNITPLKREFRMVSLDDVAPKLLLSTAKDWFAKSRWFYNVNEDYGSFESFPELQKKVRDILAGANSELDSISRLTHWVADNMRYSGISMGKGEGYTLHDARMNLNDMCGVCKDKAGMLIAMLRVAGFESYPAMTMAGSRIDDLPADQFNHCVALVKVKSEQYKLLDPTWIPFTRELWSSAEQQQNYLPGIPEGADLQITPLSAPENHYLSIQGRSRILADGTLRGEVIVTAEGQSDAAFRRFFVSSYRSGWRSYVEKMLLSAAPGMQIDSLDFGDPYDYSRPFRLVAKFIVPQYAMVSKQEVLFIPITTKLFHSQMSHLSFPTQIKKRNYDFMDRCSRLVKIDEEIFVEGAKEFGYKPHVDSVSGSGADFQGGYSLEGQKLTFQERVSLKKRVYEAKDWPSFRDAVEAQKMFFNRPVILKIK